MLKGLGFRAQDLGFTAKRVLGETFRVYDSVFGSVLEGPGLMT